MWYQDIWCMKDCKWPDVTFVTCLLTPWSRFLLEKLTGSQLVKKFPAFYGTLRFTTPFTSARHLSLSKPARSNTYSPHPTPWRSILILSYLCLGLPTKTLHTSLLSPIHATCPTSIILLDFINWTILGEEHRSLSSTLSSFLHSPVTSSLLAPNILLNTLFSNTLSLRFSTLSLRFSFSVRDQVSQPYRTTYVCICMHTHTHIIQKSCIINVNYVIMF